MEIPYLCERKRKFLLLQSHVFVAEGSRDSVPCRVRDGVPRFSVLSLSARKADAFMIHLNNVTKTYPNGSRGVEDISLHIQKGEFVFIVGSSGSGKSTLIKLLLKELDPTSGDIIINRVKTNELSRNQIPYLRRNLGVVFQDFRLLPNKTVYENVAFAMRVIEAPSRIIRRNVPAVLALVGLGKKGRSYPNQLSGGEQQRTALARAIVNNPPILICDEPTGNLDPETAWGIMQLLDDINKRGTTIVMATHARDIVDEMQKRVVTLQHGHIVRDIKKGGYSDEA